MHARRVTSRSKRSKRSGCGMWVGVGLGVIVAALAVGTLLLDEAAVPALPAPQTSTADTPPGTATPGTSSGSSAERTEAVFLGAVDGDTITTDLGTVRIIGIDTPERGECGYGQAKGEIERLLAVGDTVVLERPERQNNTDRYQRMLRYVAIPGAGVAAGTVVAAGTGDAASTGDAAGPGQGAGVDVGLAQLRAGFAVARYDSRDGYPKHPREEAYRAAQVATLGDDGKVAALSCLLTDAPGAAVGDSGAAGGGGGEVGGSGAGGSGVTPGGTQSGADEPAATGEAWFERYPSCAALKRNTVGHPKGPFRGDDAGEAAAYAWFAFGTGYRGDGDGDGVACE